MSLDSTTWSRVGVLFDEIVALPHDQRRQRLAQIESAEVREWVEKLLEAHDAPGEAIVDQALDEIVGRMFDERSDAFQVMPEDLSGKEFGNWRSVAEIGRGGMGVVMRGERADGQFEKQVAIKLLSPGPVGPERRERFLAEIRALARLEHPNIAHLIDGGISDDGIPYLVMEFVEGMRIDHWCRQTHSSVQQRLRLLLKVASAVSYAHGELVVHADIQPANVLVNSQGEPKLVDFGIAGLLRPQHVERSDSANVVLHCSPAYAALV
ncbi:MAG: serine/threonine-protein kinase, partial [Wenzhouxiangellaceae bacterium]